MKTKQKNDTRYKLVEQFMALMRSLSPTELTTFYCETCHDRLGTPDDSRPTGPFQENTGTCSHCKRFDDVSNPHVNRFLNERGVSLEYSREYNFNWVGEATYLIRDWLIPNNYASFRRDDQHYKEEPEFSWVKFGRKRAKLAYRDCRLSEASKALLMSFYPLCYSAERFAAAPIAEPAGEAKPVDDFDFMVALAAVSVEEQPLNALITVEEVVKEPQITEALDAVFTVKPIPLKQEPADAFPDSRPSTFSRIMAFVASIL